MIINDFSINWTNIFIAAIGAIISLITIYINNWLKKKKKTSDDFQAVIDANTIYREEMRKDLSLAKEEIASSKREIENCKKIIQKLEIEIKELKDKINGENGLKEQIRQCEDRFIFIANATPVGIFRTNKDGHCVFVNKEWCELTGLNYEEALNDGWKRAIHPDDSEIVMRNWDDCIKNHSHFELEYKFQRPDKTVSYVKGRALREESKDGRLLGYVGYVIETERCNNKEHEI